jgi:hypothetical protein
MADYTGVVRLSLNGERYWTNVWEHQDDFGRKYFIIALTAKDNPAKKAWSSQLRYKPLAGRYIGTLVADGQRVRLDLSEDFNAQSGRRYLRVHFQPEGSPGT